ncbi:MAG: ATP-binding protein, partial [Alphaproteobacteria bacterium]
WRFNGSETTVILIVAATVLAKAALGIGLVSAASRIDSVAAQHEGALVANGLLLKQAALKDCIVPQTLWDEAVAHLERRFDPAWASTNIVQYLSTTCSVREVYVISGSGQVMGGWVDGKLVRAQTPPSLDRAIDGLVQTLRTREARRGPFADQQAQGEMISKPINETDVVTLAKSPVVISASLVQPDFGKTLPKGRMAPIIIAVQPIDDAYVQWLRDTFLIKRPRIEIAPFDATVQHSATAILKDRGGRDVVKFSWDYDHPTQDLAWVVAPSLGLLMLILLAAPTFTILRDRRQTKRLTDAVNAANAASHAKSEFLAVMSHEIRTPLNGVLGMAQVMNRGALSSVQRDHLAVIRQSGEALLSILNDVLDLSKIEAGMLVLEPRPFDLEELALGAFGAFTGNAHSKGLSFNLDVHPGACGTYIGDSTRVRQILHNLLSNALKFTDQGEIRVSIDRRDENIVFRVSDTGAGIASDRLVGIFDRFVQADSSITRKYGGSGLGLAITRDLCTAMGGSVTVTSQPGMGTTFEVLLPLEVAETPAVLQAPETENSGSFEAIPTFKILAAEDNPNNQMVLKTLLAQFDLSVTIVEDGLKAVDRWRAEDWDLILMDVQMPVLDGPSAVRLIRELEIETGRTPVPIVALTANAMTHQVETYYAVGMNDVLVKPIEISNVLRVIQAVANAESYVEAIDALNVSRAA